MTAGRGVVDVVAAQAEDPVPLASRDLLRAQDGARVLGVRGAGRGVDPLLGDLLHLPVERRGDAVAAGVDFAAVVGGVGAQDVGERVADLPHEVRRLPVRRHDGVSTTGSDFAASYSAAVCVRPVSGLRVFISSRTWLRRWTISDVSGTTSWNSGHSSPSSTLLEADLLGVLHEVELGR